MEPDDFYQIMKQHGLNDIAAWTVSTINKEPLNPKPALAAHFDRDTFHQWFELCGDPDTELVTLDELYAEPNTPRTQCALRVDVSTQHVMLVDIEQEFNHDVLPYLKKMPAIYGENSRHGGLHYIVALSNDILNDDKYHDLFFKSQVKFGQTDKKHTGVEIFFHNHYLTFTQNQLVAKNKNTDDDLRVLLDYLIDHEAANNTTLHGSNLVSDEMTIPTDALVIAEHMIDATLDRKIKASIHKTQQKYPDVSQQEYREILYLAHRLLDVRKDGFSKNPILKDELINENALNDPSLLTWTVIYLATHYLPARDKWNKQYQDNNQNYLEYTCDRLMSKLLSQ